MKINRTAVAAAASVVAVVVAGTAALAANFGILTSSGDDEVTTPRVLSTLGDESFVNVPVEEITDSSEPSETLAYQVEDVGVVTLERTGDSLEIVAVDVDSQWAYTESTAERGVAIRFESSSQVIGFSAIVVDGQVIVDVVDETPIASSDTYDDDSHGGDDDGGHDDGYEDDGSYEDD